MLKDMKIKRYLRCKTKNSDLVHCFTPYCCALAKHKIIRLNEKCLEEYDKHIYPHTIAIKDDSGIDTI